MYKTCFAIFLLAFSPFIYSQLPRLQWATAMHSTYADGFDTNNGRSVSVDPQGNVYSIGFFMNTVDFDPGPAVFELTAEGPSHWGHYILKQDRDGRFTWVKQLPLKLEFAEVEMETDADGSVYVTAYIDQPTDMDPGPAVQIISPAGGKDAFVLKLDTNGNMVWVKLFGGPGITTSSYTSSVDIDAAGNVYTVGIFTNTVDFDPGVGIFNLSTDNRWEGFISKLNKNGEFVWVKQIGKFTTDEGSVQTFRVKCDAGGNCFFSGNFGGTCDFDPGPAEYRVTAISTTDGYIVSLDADGNFKWMRHIGKGLDGYVSHRALTLDENNNVYSAGTFDRIPDFDPGPGMANISSFDNNFTAYILKLDANGNYTWAKKMSVTGNSDGWDVTIDNAGNIYTTALYYGDIDFGPGPGTTVFPGMYAETILTKFNADGDLQYAAPFLGKDKSLNLHRRMVCDAESNLYVTGYFYGQVDFDPGPLAFNINGSRDGTPFVLKLTHCKNPTDTTIDVIACNEYTLNSNIYKLPGTYYQTIPNAAGCDSIITLRLTLNKKNTEQKQTICEGTSFFAGGTNQIKTGTYTDTLLSATGCDSIVTTHLLVNPKPVPLLGADRNICENTPLNLSPGVFQSYLWQDGSTQNNFTVSVPGTYAVSVANNFNCKATDTILIKAIVTGPKDFLTSIDSVCTYRPLTVQPYTNFQQYLWSTGSLQKTISINTAGEYWLEVKDINGCYGRDTIAVFSKTCPSGVYIPTAFTPDGNGQNDVFRALVFAEVKTFRLQVFNRWGELVFETKDPGRGWDGQVKGKKNQTTLFAWLCSYQLENAAPVTQKGTVLLIR